MMAKKVSIEMAEDLRSGLDKVIEAHGDSKNIARRIVREWCPDGLDDLPNFGPLGSLGKKFQPTLKEWMFDIVDDVAQFRRQEELNVDSPADVCRTSIRRYLFVHRDEYDLKDAEIAATGFDESTVPVVPGPDDVKKVVKGLFEGGNLLDEYGLLRDAIRGSSTNFPNGTARSMIAGLLLRRSRSSGFDDPDPLNSVLGYCVGRTKNGEHPIHLIG